MPEEAGVFFSAPGPMIGDHTTAETSKSGRYPTRYPENDKLPIISEGTKVGGKGQESESDAGCKYWPGHL